MSPEARLERDEAPSGTDLGTLGEDLLRWNLRRVGRGDCRPFAVWLRDASGAIRGGIAGETRWEWAHLSILWIEEAWRGRGFGHALLREAERIARERGCRLADLETFSFQAPGFYARHGWREVFVLEGIGHGVRRHHFVRELEPEAPGFQA